MSNTLASSSLSLAFFADVGQQGMAAVADFLFGRHHARHLDLQSGAFPSVEAANQRFDVAVAHFLQVAGGQGRTHPARAVEHDGHVRVEGVLLDAQLQKSAWNKDRARHVSQLELLSLADVDHQRPLAILDRRIQRLGRYFSNLALRQSNQLISVQSCHWCLSFMLS